MPGFGDVDGQNGELAPPIQKETAGFRMILEPAVGAFSVVTFLNYSSLSIWASLRLKASATPLKVI